MIKVVIVEDEFNAQNTLSKLLKYTQKDIDVIATIDTVNDAILFLNENTPDLVFLDIELIGGNAFTILDALDKISFRIIFTTAYDDFAIQAIRVDAIDYLLKPIDSDELTACIDRFRTLYKQDKKVLSLEMKIQDLETKDEHKNLLIKTTQEQHILPLNDIIRCQSDGSYTIFYTADKKIMSARNLKYYENILSEQIFVRVHQSHLININYIESIVLNNILLKDGEKIPLASRKKSYLKQFLANL
ncbi:MULTISPECIES: LytR/AlgR family response regulator transcription factor [unclassified Cellulophaga]|uniref:LytR/AlgR family response regulator transcription factor n=1 Tax=unclassified Cellulophaga TaxID=2634405 RepID=UPI0026E1732C|nr:MULTISPECIES: LytTR family DNA-binding domain-containing protein [unclassified Cellulophaga]MDO6490993.1 LytTR family DNA-binding domain-containing protein [Cellulophaga sp. 2_MG-2023]MDO6493813.1 LytTR family DNA-binding domain-containing protein [Cellulophaga sp. 3_MG-2023]